eukprot:768498-Hanusia_phi.AAC.1
MAPTNHRDEVSCGKKAAKKGSKNIHPELLQEMRKMEMMLKFKDQVDVDQVHRDLLLILAKVDRVPPSVRQKIHELLVSLACSNHNAEAAIRFLEAVKETWTPSESAYASVIRVCCERADTAKHALNLLDDFIVNNPNRLRLRTVQPLLYAFMHSRELRSFVDLWKCVLRSHPDLIKSAANSSIEPVEQLFVDVIKAFSEEIGSAEGSEMRFLMENLDEILIEMSETLLSISEKSANFLSSNVLHESCNIVNISSDGHCPIRLFFFVFEDLSHLQCGLSFVPWSGIEHLTLMQRETIKVVLSHFFATRLVLHTWSRGCSLPNSSRTDRPLRARVRTGEDAKGRQGGSGGGRGGRGRG